MRAHRVIPFLIVLLLIGVLPCQAVLPDISTGPILFHWDNSLETMTTSNIHFHWDKGPQTISTSPITFSWNSPSAYPVQKKQKLHLQTQPKTTPIIPVPAKENLRVASRPGGVPLPEIQPMPGQSLFTRVPVSLKIRYAPQAVDKLVFEFQRHDGRAWRATRKPAFLVATKAESLGEVTVTQPVRFSAPGQYRWRCKVKGENAWTAWSPILEIRDIGGGREAKPSGAQDLQTGTKPSAAGTRGKSPGQGLRRETGPVRPNGRRNPGVGTSDTPTHPRSRLPSDTLRTLRNPSE